jgi:Tol biopolymer transport system component
MGEPQPLTEGSGRHSRPSFSPDGTRIAYDHWRVGSSQDIWTMAPDGSDPRQLTVDTSTDTQTSWLADGSGVVYFSERNQQYGLWSTSLESGLETLVATLRGDMDSVRLSPDGTRLAYHTAGADGPLNLWIARWDGAEARQLTFDRELMAFPCWSPDGRWLAFEMRRGDDDHVMVIPADGGEPTQLTFDPGKSWPYGWSPAGDKIVFAALRDGFWNLRWVSRSTDQQRQLTHFEMPAGYVRYPAWSPEGDQIVFELAETTGDLWLVESPP